MRYWNFIMLRTSKKLVFFILILLCRQAHSENIEVPSVNCPDIQSAIALAKNGDTITVAPGTYKENINFLGKAVKLTSLDPNNPSIVQATIIDGSNPPDINFASVVTFNSGEDNRSILTGFTITGGTGSWLLISWMFRGLNWNRCGGGIVCYNQSEPTILKNVLTGNLAAQGGGIYVYGDPVNPDNPLDPNVHITPVIKDNTFINNNAITNHGFSPPNSIFPANDHGDGGAITCFQGCDPDITGNIIINNFADFYGGGIHLRQWCSGLIKDNRINNNKSSLGAGIHITYASSPLIAGNLIELNNSSSGSAIYVYYLSAPLITANRIRRNYAINGTIGIHFESTGELSNNLIEDNYGSPAVLTSGCFVLISHNTIINNQTTAIQCNGSPAPEIVNNIIALSKGGYGINTGIDSKPVIKYNNLWQNSLGNYGPGLQDLTGNEGNISVNPRFLIQPNITVHLNYDSPCIDAGDPNFINGSSLSDLDGDPRVMNAVTDIGADEAFSIWNITKQKHYSRIQDAIDDANDLDSIIALQGRYCENIAFAGKNISLRSLCDHDWACIERTIIDGNNTDNPVVSFSGVEDSNCIISGFTITGANHSGYGGAISGNGTKAVIQFCNLTGNYAAKGAGVHYVDGLITNCKINNNSSSLVGGGICSCLGNIYNCIITNNHAADSGGGIFNCDGDIINNTIAGNVAGISGGAIRHCGGSITNNIIWLNDAPNSPAIQDSNHPTYCSLQESSAGEGNIFTYPLFIDVNNGNFHLPIHSDCIDAGDNNSIPSNPDIDNEQRIFTFRLEGAPRIDIGADEVTTRKSDFNQDGTVNSLDLSILVNEWLETGTGLQSDLTGSGTVDFYDYAILASDWLWLAPWFDPVR